MKFKNYLVLIIGVFGIWLLPFCGGEDDEDTSMEETEEQCEQWTAERQSQCMINGTYDSANCECDCDEGFSGELCQDEDVEEEPCEITEESVDTCNVNGIFDDDLCECVCELGWSGDLCNEEIDPCANPESLSLQDLLLCPDANCAELIASGNYDLEEFYGLEYKGGYIFDFNLDEGYCKIAAKNTSQVGVHWGCYGSYLGTPEDFLDNEGYFITDYIFSECGNVEIQLIGGNPVEVPTTAAGVCQFKADLEKKDWYLPSLIEFQTMQVRLFDRGFGDLVETNYWTASDVDEERAWRWDFESATAKENDKYGKFLVQPVLIVIE